MPKIIIDNKEIEFENGMTVMQTCELADVEIPRLCMTRWCPLLVILISCGSTAPVVFTHIFLPGEQS